MDNLNYTSLDEPKKKMEFDNDKFENILIALNYVC